MAKVKKQKKKIQVDAHGVAHIKATFNNTIVTITDKYGNVLAWSSGGRIGYKGTKKGTPFAAQLAAEAAAKEAYTLSLLQSLQTGPVYLPMIFSFDFNF